MCLRLGLYPSQLHTKKDNPGHRTAEQDLVLEITWRSGVLIPSVNGSPTYPRGSDLSKCFREALFGEVLGTDLRSPGSWPAPVLVDLGKTLGRA